MFRRLVLITASSMCAAVWAASAMDRPRPLEVAELITIRGGQYGQKFCDPYFMCDGATTSCPGGAVACTDKTQDAPCEFIPGVEVTSKEEFMPYSCELVSSGLPCETPITYVNVLCWKRYLCLCNLVNGTLVCNKAIMKETRCEYISTARDLCSFQACPQS